MTQVTLPWQSVIYEDELSKEDMELRDAVVKEYLFDRNWVNACKRLGMSQAMASEYAQRFSADPYCIRRLKTLELEAAHAPAANKKQKLEEEKLKLIRQLEEQSTYYGPGSSHGARVAALKQLCAIHGIDAPKNTNVNVGIQSGVMLVPMTGTMEDWEKASGDSQKKLQEDTLNGVTGSGTVH